MSTGCHRMEQVRPQRVRGGKRKAARPPRRHQRIGLHLLQRLRPGIRIKAGLALGAVAVIGTGGSWASWTDSVPISGVTLTSGIIDLKVNGADSLPAYADLNASLMVPGSTTATVLTVRNSGSGPLNYTAATTASANALTTALLLNVTSAATVTGTGLSRTCGIPAITGPSALGGALMTASRTLAAGAQETICVQLTLPAAAPNEAQNLSSAITVTFSATM